MNKQTGEAFDRAAFYLRAMADPLRLRILDQIRDNPQYVKDIVKAVGVSQPTVSKHLGILRRAGIVETERMGTLVKYRARNDYVYKVADMVAGVILVSLPTIETAISTLSKTVG